MYGTSTDDDGHDPHPDGEEEADANEGNSKPPSSILLTLSIHHLQKKGTIVDESSVNLKER